ncbi:Nucleolar protein 8 [Aphelenchoides bicaudatus]|nr:Nucleolar protein 8 [Aphelenchoides bicaudatus]
MAEDDIDKRFQIDERFKEEEFDKEFDKADDEYQRPAVKSFQRFDPDDPGHLAWMEANKDDVVNRKKTKAFDVEAFNNEIETNDRRVIEGQFYEVDQSFAKELKQMLAEKSNGTTEKFSFLSMIGRAHEPETSTQEPTTEMPTFKPKKLREEDDQTPVPTSETPQEKPIEKPFFFIDTKDKQFRDVLNAFSCQQKLELIRKKWEVDREKITKRYKNVHKTAVRKREKDMQNEVRGKKRGNSQSNKRKNKQAKKKKTE